MHEFFEVVRVARELEDEGSAAHLLFDVFVEELDVFVELVYVRHFLRFDEANIANFVFVRRDVRGGAAND